MQFWSEIGRQSFDLATSILPPAPPEAGAIVVAIDEPSFAALGRAWPWPRGLHADLVQSLRRAGARAIAFDIVFAEPSDPSNDAALAGATDSRTILAADETLAETPQGTMLIRTGPIDLLRSKGALVGTTAIPVDGDGVVRSIPRYPDSLPRQLNRAAGFDESAPNGDQLIQFFGPARTYPYVSYYQALDAEHLLPPAMLRGRDVIVGMALQTPAEVRHGADQFETIFTRFSRQLTPGAEIHATVADNLRHELWIRPAPAWIAFVLLLLGGVTGWVTSVPKAAARRLMGAVSIALVMLVATWLLVRFGRVWVSPGEPLIAHGAVFLALGARDYAVERRRRRELHRTFSQYMAPALVDRLVERPELLKLGGESREVTILFADIRGFTSVAEAMKDDAEALTELINDILAPLSDIVMEEGGTIDKYVGDCVMALWNAPLDDPDHAGNAIRAGLKMIEVLPALNARLAERLPRIDGSPVTVRIGVGINSGTCVVGNMGSHRRFEYTVIGDAVNVASRLEALSKELPAAILIGEATAELAADEFDFVEIDRLQVRGRRETLRVYTVANGEESRAMPWVALSDCAD
jgi:adenylate cyclase